jgi:uncharacterized protein (TIGR03437 family)
LASLIETGPPLAASVAFSVAEASRLKALDSVFGEQLEQTIDLEGQIDALVADDARGGKSRTMYFFSSAGNRYRLFGANIQDRLLCGQLARINGIALKGAIAATSISFKGSSRAAESPCPIIGEQKAAVILVSLPGTRLAATVTPPVVQNYFFGTTGSLSSYWREASFNRTSLSGTVYGPVVLDRDYGCVDVDQVLNATIRALDNAIDFTQVRRIFIIKPYTVDCGFTIGQAQSCRTLNSPSRGAFSATAAFLSIAADNVQYLGPGAVHEGGHNLGLQHAGTITHPDEPLGPLEVKGTFDEYGDDYAGMGGQRCTGGRCTTGHYSAVHKYQLGWLDMDTNIQTVERSGTFVLQPYAAPGGGLRALRVRRPGTEQHTLWVEYRQPIGSDQTLEIFSPLVFSGALVRQADAPGFEGTGLTGLIDFHPVSTPGNFTDAALSPGESWSDPYSILTIRINRTTAAGLEVTVSFDAPCVSLAPASAFHPGAAGSGSIVVSAAPGCSWKAAANVPWLSITSRTTGAGNGTLSYAVSPNNTVASRTGSMSVGRLAFTVSQAASFQTVYSNLGAGDAFNTSSGYTLGGGALNNNGGVQFAAAFTPQATSVLSGVEMAVGTNGRSTTNTPLQIVLFDDSAGTPGNTLERWMYPVLTIARSVVSVSSVAKPLLRAGTKYWLAAAPVDLINTAYGWFSNTTGATAETASQTGAGPWRLSTGANTVPAFRIRGVDVPVVTPSITSVVHGATLQSAPLAPGMVVAIIGQDFESDSTVLLDGKAQLPVDSMTPTQINGAMLNNTSVDDHTIAVTSGSTASAATKITVVAQNIAVFQVSDAASGQQTPLITDENGNLLGDPSFNSPNLKQARAGGQLVIWATGGGAALDKDGNLVDDTVPNPAGPYALVQVPKLQIDGADVTPTSATRAPGSRSKDLIILQLPDDIASGQHTLTVGENTYSFWVK